MQCCLLRRLLPLACALLSSPAFAAVLRVDAAAPGPAHDGATWATAYTTVSAAVSAAAAGDEVWVAGGAYRETVKPPRSVSLYGGFAGSETERGQRDWVARRTVLDGGQATLTVPTVEFTASGATSVLDGFTVTGGRGAGVRCGGLGTTVRNCVVHGNRRGGINPIGGTATLVNNTITGNSDGGVVANNATVVATNNTITGNTGAGFSIRGGQATFVNNVAAFNVGGLTRYAGERVDVRSNDVFGNTAYQYGGSLAGYASTGGNQSVDPRLSNPYDRPHLQPDSPCIDAGDDSVVADGDVDMDAQPRIQGAHVDIGADESDGATWPAAPTILHVSPDGDDGNDGRTWQTAKKTIGAALAAAHGGDEVWVAAGAYPEYVSIPAGVSLYGGFAGTEAERGERDLSTHRTVIDQGKVIADFKDIVVDGLEIRNGTSGVTSQAGVVTIAHCEIHGQSFGGVSGAGASLTVARNAIHHNRATRGGGLYVNGGSLTLTGNAIHDNASDKSEPGGGLWCNVNATVTNNVFSGNSAGFGGGVYWSTGTGTFINNTLVSNTAPSGGAVYCESGRLTFHNNIIAFNGANGIQRFGGLITGDSSNNDVFGNSGYDFGATATGTGPNGNISVDPWLVTSSGVSHLQPGSPCINAGNDSVVTPDDRDIDGQARIQGGRVDIGADESDGATWPGGGKTVYVTTSGDDTQDGLTWGTAKKTMRAALSTATSGDEVWVAEGSYPVALDVPAGVALYGGFAGGETRREERDWRTHVSALQGGSETAVTIAAQNATVDGFTIRGGYGAKGGGVACLSATARIANSVITGNFAVRGSGVYVEGGQVTLVNNVITDNNGLGNPGESGGGVYCLNGKTTMIGNVITRNVAASGGGVYAGSGASMTLLNNTVAGNNAANGAVHAAANAAVTLVNDIVAFNSSGVKNDGGTVTLSHSDVAMNDTFNYTGMADPAGQDGNIAADPRFVEPPASSWSLGGPSGDLHLTAASPCINTGDDAFAIAGTLDIDGNPRIQGAHVDMGALEFSGTLPPSPADVIRALRLAGGLTDAAMEDLARLDTDASGAVNLLDAVALARESVGAGAP